MSHSNATREAVQARLTYQKEIYEEFTSPARDVFDKTSAYISALRRTGCRSTSMAENSKAEDTSVCDERYILRRGYPELPNRCTGQLEFGFTFDGTPYIK